MNSVSVSGLLNYTQGYASNYNSGALYWDGATKQLKIIDGTGNSSIFVVPNTHISTSTLVDDTVNWAIRKMAEESRLDELCKQHPGLKDVREKYEIMLALVQKEGSNDGNK